MPLHYVDPNKKRGRLYKANVRYARSRAGQAYALRIGWRIDPWLYRATGGRYPWRPTHDDGCQVGSAAAEKYRLSTSTMDPIQS